MCIFMPIVYLSAMYIFMPIVYLSAMYIFMPIVYLSAMYIFMPIVYLSAMYIFMPSTPSSQVYVYGTGGWHPAAGREGACTPCGCFQCTEMAESATIATLPAMSDKGIYSPTLQDRLVQTLPHPPDTFCTYWQASFFPGYRLHICFLHGLFLK